jgi:excisionase family DNA binding protein
MALATARVPHGEHWAVPGAVVALDDLPLMLTITEAAAVLRVSRTTAYKLAEDWRATQGRTGLPTVRLRGRLLVRRVDLAVIVGAASD